MSTDRNDNWRGADDVLDRANALLNKHRPPTHDATANGLEIPTLTDVVASNVDGTAIPTLYDVFHEPALQEVDALSSTAEPDAPSAPLSSEVLEPNRAATESPLSHSGEVISRVQSQNLEHSIYQKVKQELDAQIVGILETRFMPEVVGALDQALHKISDDLKTKLDAAVRASIDEKAVLHADTRSQLTSEKAIEDSSQENDPTATGVTPPAEPSEAPMLAKSFEPRLLEDKWYARWEESGHFKHANDPSKPAYCIQLPPPNVTGTLHMGHAFQQTLMDILIRYHRMQGCDTNWIVGADHAGIATQIVVERQLLAEGKTRHELGRDAFVERVWQWKRQSGATITHQMRRLGVSANWDYARSAESVAANEHSGYFTMDANMSRAVVEVFARLYEEGLIYRGKRLVNWDPMLGTAVSDLEVDSEEEDGKIWEIKYPLVETQFLDPERSWLSVATTRPETLLGDAAIAVHPEDERYRDLIGRHVHLPLTGRTIPIIADSYVDREFGTGCVKITPAHDFNDWQVGQRHGLPAHIILTLNGTIIGDSPSNPLDAPQRPTDSENDANSGIARFIPKHIQGLDRFEARKRIIAELKAHGLLIAEKPYRLRVPRSNRSDAIVEPMLTDQWFMKMEGLAARGLEVVNQELVRFYPEHWASTYNQWLANIQDWCISRQLWWGHQIPAWYDDQGSVFVARSEEEVRAKYGLAGHIALRRDPDVLDTWFSSALVPFSSLGWPQRTEDLEIYLPSAVLVTGFDIIFFWVARMIMMTLHFTGKVPFHDVYINALVRDSEGQKMSKSKGNTLDPLDLIDGITLEALLAKSKVGLLRADHRDKVDQYIRKNFPQGIPAFGTDALRFTFASLASLAQTLNFDLNRCDGYRNFCNKLWNATRFVLMNCDGKDVGLDLSTPLEVSEVDKWIISRLQRTEAEVAQAYADYRFDNAARAIYELVWDEYCDWYLEFAKVRLASSTAEQQRATRRTLVRVLEAMLRLAHPIMPFITEELWQKIAPLAGHSGPSIMIQPYPQPDASRIDEHSEQQIALLKQLINGCRTLRSEMNLGPDKKPALIIAGNPRVVEPLVPYIQFLGKLSKVSLVDHDLPATEARISIVEEYKLMLEIEIDVNLEKARLIKELATLEAQMAKSDGRLADARFVDRAPAAVVAQERQRRAQFAATLEKLQRQLTILG